MKKITSGLYSVLLVFTVMVITGCNQSERVSKNISKEADNFNVVRRVTVINTRTDKIEFEVVGNISIDTADTSKLVIIAQTDEKTFKKHIISLTEWNMYVLEDLEGAEVNKYKYEVNYMPESIIPYTITTD